MTKAEQKPGAIAKRTALAIINSTVNPALRHDATNVTAVNLAKIIERETAITELLEVLELCSFEMGYANWGKPEAITARQDCLAKARAAIAKAKGE